MDIAIFHYHLNPGGVTRIIESQVVSLKKAIPGVNLNVFAGVAGNKRFFDEQNVTLELFAPLNYLENKVYSKEALQQLYRELYHYLKKRISAETILHVHNLNLGKNPVLTLVFHQLLHEGHQIINHAHDFSEDRPVNHGFMKKIIEHHFRKNLNQVMYPDANNYSIGVLNQFDFERVQNKGINKTHLFLWPNPVHVPTMELPDRDLCRQKLLEVFDIAKNKKIVTYPVRVIRRKNIGELVLLALLFADCQFMVTLPPKNPVEIRYYEKWKEFCLQNQVPLIFEAGEKVAFADILTGSDFCITTSKQEGFGMAFLEPWLFGTPVIGRDIPSVTTDIMREGVKFPLLYNKINLDHQNSPGDFKDLGEEQQQEFIISLRKNQTAIHAFKKQNPFLNGFPPKTEDGLIEHNRKVIEEKFSIEQYGERLYQAYKALS